MASLRGAIYTSATLTGNGNSGVLDIGGDYERGFFAVVGEDMAGDETNDITIDWYWDSDGTLSLGTTTFDQISSGSTGDVELWPGDITTRDHPIPIPRFFKISWTLGGTAKSMKFTLYAELRGED